MAINNKYNNDEYNNDEYNNDEYIIVETYDKQRNYGYGVRKMLTAQPNTTIFKDRDEAQYAINKLLVDDIAAGEEKLNTGGDVTKLWLEYIGIDEEIISFFEDNIDTDLNNDNLLDIFGWMNEIDDKYLEKVLANKETFKECYAKWMPKNEYYDLILTKESEIFDIKRKIAKKERHLKSKQFVLDTSKKENEIEGAKESIYLTNEKLAEYNERLNVLIKELSVLEINRENADAFDDDVSFEIWWEELLTSLNDCKGVTLDDFLNDNLDALIEMMKYNHSYDLRANYHIINLDWEINDFDDKEAIAFFREELKNQLDVDFVNKIINKIIDGIDNIDEIDNFDDEEMLELIKYWYDSLTIGQKRQYVYDYIYQSKELKQ